MIYGKTKFIIFLLALIVTGLGWFFIFSQKMIIINTMNTNDAAKEPEKIIVKAEENKKINTDIENQSPLQNPPEIINAVYMTSWSAGTESRVNYLINLKKTTKINAAVIDIKDYTGYIAYDIGLPQVEQYKAKEIRIRNINSLIKRLHDEGIYLIARIAVFEDTALAKARPDLAVKRKIQSSPSSTPEYAVWKDNKGLLWTDPTSKEVWDYNIAIAKDAASRGFDEINFDYIRFPSDGDMLNMHFASLSGSSKSEMLKNFFKYLRESLKNIRTSADVFGLVTVIKNDMGIGQIIEDIYPYFDFVSPMIYPSHYYSGTLGYKNPAAYPYEIIKYSMDGALSRLIAMETELETENASSTAPIIENEAKLNAKIRPWLQDFNLGATYTKDMIKLEIKAVNDSLGARYNGFMMWSPSNVYVKEALQ